MSTWKSLVVIIRDSYRKPISPPYHHKRFPSQKLNKHLQMYGTWKNNFQKKIGGPLIFLRKFCRSSVDGGEVMNPPSSHGKPSFAGFKSLVNWTASAPRRSWLILRLFRHSTKKKQMKMAQYFWLQGWQHMFQSWVWFVCNSFLRKQIHVTVFF